MINRPLPEEMVGPALGQFKLEHEIHTAIFVAPKVYGFITTEGTTILKVKGVAKEEVDKLTLKDLMRLLILETSHLFTQKKWFLRR